MKMMQWIHRELRIFQEWTIVRDLGYNVGYFEMRKAWIDKNQNHPRIS